MGLEKLILYPEGGFLLIFILIFLGKDLKYSRLNQ